jgi:5-methylcytosine-specific restriction endonuclease McrA
MRWRVGHNLNKKALIMSDTLVLDPTGIPISTMKWQDALTLYFKNRCIVIDSDPVRILHAQNFEMNMPVVIQLKNAFARRLRREVPFSRRSILIRDEQNCQYCGKKCSSRQISYDHVIPRSRGGISSWKNLVIACVDCNFYKANRTPEEAGMKLIRKPYQPKVDDKRFHFRLSIKKLKPQWQPWSKWLYWNIVLDP